MSSPRLKIAIVGTAMLFLLNPSSIFAQGFSVTDLGTLPGICCSAANAINFWGRAAGVSTDAFVSGPQVGMQDLGTLSGGGYSSATAVNFFGEVAGFSGTSGGTDRAILWTPRDGMRGLGLLPKATSSDAYGLNDYGVVVGDSSSPKGFDHAFFWTYATGMADLGTLPGGNVSRATGANDYDNIVGFSTINKNTQTRTYHAFLFTPLTGMCDLGTLPGEDNSYAYAINQRGHVAGESLLSTAGNDHAVLWGQQHSKRDLGVLPGGTISIANALNDSDVVVGFGDFTNSGGAIHAFRWTGAGGMEDLNNLIPANSGWTLLEATGINATGQIVGTGVIQGSEHAFLLTPDASAQHLKSPTPGDEKKTSGSARYFPNCSTTPRGSGSVRIGCKRDER